MVSFYHYQHQNNRSNLPKDYSNKSFATNQNERNEEKESRKNSGHSYHTYCGKDLRFSVEMNNRKSQVKWNTAKAYRANHVLPSIQKQTVFKHTTSGSTRLSKQFSVYESHDGNHHLFIFQSQNAQNDNVSPL